MNVRCPGCGGAVALAVGDTRLACAACGLAAPISRIGTEPDGTTKTGAVLVTLETDLTGSVLAGRTIVERIGAGGMGTVYRARGDNGDVAIKVLRPALGVDRAAALARFSREADALRRLDHPHVVRFLEHGEEAGVAYIVTELVKGRDLAATLADGRMSLARIVDVMSQVCDGVAAAHAAGIVHRDLKPANILVGEDGVVKIADFGLAQLGPDAALTTLTRTNVAMGTFHYLAPEQRKDAHGIDHRADIWAIGVILYEMLTGELPLGSFAPPSANGPAGCDRRADAVIRRALAPDPADRFASAAHLGLAVRALAPRTPRPRRLALAAAFVFLGVAGGAVAMTQMGERPTPQAQAIQMDAALVAVTPMDAFVDEPDAAPLDASVPVDASVPIDAAAVVAVRPPKPKPAAGSGSTGGKGKTMKPRPVKAKVEPTAPAVCWKARSCCQGLKQPNCGSYLQMDETACRAALAEMRPLAGNNLKLAFRCRG